MKYVRGPRGNNLLMDDWRESYYWLRQNTKEDAVIASWWDYGYQIAGFSNRTTVVDNNTWNNTHIAQVGRILASPEAKAWKLAKELDIDYFLVFFGGINGHSGDDINKFMWMIRIAQGVFPDDVKEKDFLSSRGRYSPGKEDLTPTFRDSLMYKLSYNEFGSKYKIRNQKGEVYGYDQVRRVEIGDKNFKLKYFEEVYTTSKGLVRLYRLKSKGELFGAFSETRNAIKKRRSKKIKKKKPTKPTKLVKGKRSRAQPQFQM